MKRMLGCHPTQSKTSRVHRRNVLADLRVAHGALGHELSLALKNASGAVLPRRLFQNGPNFVVGTCGTRLKQPNQQRVVEIAVF